MHNSGQLRKHVGIRFRWIGVVSNGEFDDGQTEGPHVGGGSVGCGSSEGFAFYSFGLQRMKQISNPISRKEPKQRCAAKARKGKRRRNEKRTAM